MKGSSTVSAACAMPPSPSLEDSDYDSSWSSITTRASSHGWISDCSFTSSSSSSPGRKPHKANHPHWEALRLLRRHHSPLGLHHFHLLRRLGSGDIGTVYLCRLRSSAACLYAMKVVDREALAVKNKLVRAETEKDILSFLDHPFLPTLYAHFGVSRYSCILMEFCPGGDLHAARLRSPGGRFTVFAAKFYAAEALMALEYLHLMGVVYRDLKPENVLVREDGHIMLSDFDLSFKCEVRPQLLRGHRNNSRPPPTRLLSCFSAAASTEVEPEPELVVAPVSAQSKSFVGTHEYLAPEVIAGSGHGAAVDWWTFGIFLFELLYGTTPFKGETNDKTLVNIIQQPLTFPKSSPRSSREGAELAKARDLISRLLMKNPKKRLGSLKGSAEIKRHELFKGVNWALIRSAKPPEVPRDPMKKARSRAVVGGVPLHFEFF